MATALLKSNSVNQSLRYLVKYTPRGNPITSSFPMAIYAKRMPNRSISKWLLLRGGKVIYFLRCSILMAVLSTHNLSQLPHH